MRAKNTIAFVSLLFPGVIIFGLMTSTASAADLSEANNVFALQLFEKVSTENKNFVCSPLSVSVVLSMLLDGATDPSTTESEIRQTLGYSTTTDVDAGYTDLLPKLQSTTNYQLNLANSIWVQNDFTILQTYKDKMTTVFKADANSFGTPSDGVTQINSWVAAHTNNKITKLFDTLPDETVLVLVNAIYFLGNWIQQFNVNRTAPGIFQSGNSQVTVDFMFQEKIFPYKDSSSLNAQILHLPYKGNDVYLAIVLPKNVQTDLNSIISNSNFETETFGNLPNETVNMKIPKFKIETSIPLNSPLTQLGMQRAFTSSAEFSRITNSGQIKVDNVFQKAIIQVDETGTEAAAATGAVVTTTSVNLNLKYFNANRPFIFALYHKPTESILFLGKYYGQA